jgi:hypothetical protein
VKQHRLLFRLVRGRIHVCCSCRHRAESHWALAEEKRIEADEALELFRRHTEAHKLTAGWTR